MPGTTILHSSLVHITILGMCLPEETYERIKIQLWAAIETVVLSNLTCTRALCTVPYSSCVAPPSTTPLLARTSCRASSRLLYHTGWPLPENETVGIHFSGSDLGRHSATMQRANVVAHILTCQCFTHRCVRKKFRVAQKFVNDVFVCVCGIHGFQCRRLQLKRAPRHARATTAMRSSIAFPMCWRAPLNHHLPAGPSGERRCKGCVQRRPKLWFCRHSVFAV